MKHDFKQNSNGQHANKADQKSFIIVFILEPRFSVTTKNALKGSEEYFRALLAEMYSSYLQIEAKTQKGAVIFVAEILDSFQSTPHCGRLGGAIYLKLGNQTLG